ncbi:MAG: tRNA lysidine(34) synthetase TilS [Bacteroidetes bacterium]|nr:tRNA lysidine(34) synthetase TilS [Bacteroidota bacterium]
MPQLDSACFRRHVVEGLGLLPSARIVVGVSGGADSVVLLRLFHEAGFSITVCHVNYGLRGAESDGDEAFVCALADELGIPVRVRRVELPEAGNRQEAARDARYAFFRETAETVGAEAVAVAHHQDDQAETVLLNLFRGAGPHGLAGMPASRPLAPDSSIQLIRPLLGWPRADIENLAGERGWAWREDASNASDMYRRNWLRNQVLPLIEEEFGEGVSRRIADVAERIRAVVDLVDGGASSWLSIDELRALPKTQRHSRYLSALRQFAPAAPRRADAVAELDALLDAQPGKRVVWPGVTVWRERDALVIKPGRDDTTPKTWPARIGASTKTPFGTLAVEPLESVPADPTSTDNNLETADADAFAGPLHLRLWRDGYRFNPLGLGGSKLVSDLLTEAKVPASQRADQLVLLSGGSIVWVVGRRLAEEARIVSSTKRAVRLVWVPIPPTPS